MTSVYLINVGANMSHRGKARSPIFDNGSWVFVSFPTSDPEPSPGQSCDALPFLHNRNVDPTYTHADPCWNGLSYGDNCANPRARSLKGVTKGDILLFWGLLWRNNDRSWDGFTGEHGWYLFGALRVEEIAIPGQSLHQVSEHNRLRAGKNAHFVKGGGLLPLNNYVFLGNPRYSSKFLRAVDLEVDNSSGLVYRAFTSAKGGLLAWDQKPSWRSSLRSCRKIWDLKDHAARSRAQIVSDVILEQTGFDFLENL
jgi:hypothetical protein